MTTNTASSPSRASKRTSPQLQREWMQFEERYRIDVHDDFQEADRALRSGHLREFTISVLPSSAILRYEHPSRITDLDLEPGSNELRMVKRLYHKMAQTSWNVTFWLQPLDHTCKSGERKVVHVLNIRFAYK